MLKIQLPKEYGYFVDVVNAIKNGKKILIDEFNLVGGRKSCKTTSEVIMWVLACIHCKCNDFGLIAFRNTMNGAQDLFDDIIPVLEAYQIEYTCKVSRGEITFNGNKLRICGVNSMTKNKQAKRSGLPRFSDIKYAFIWFEERFEFEERDIRSVMEAVRCVSLESNTQYIIINTCNPWAMNSDYISYCGKYQTWNINTLKTTGSQVGVYDIDIGNGMTKRALFHYTNWRVGKQFLTESEIRNIVDTWNIDPKRAATVDWGLPGYESGAIYTHVLNNLGNAIYQEHEMLIGGGDYGWGRDANSGKTVFYFGGASVYQEACIDLYAEYQQDNKTNVKAPDQVAKEVVLFYFESMREYCNRIGWTSAFNLSVRVDNMAIGFISLLNAEAQKHKLNWLRFVKCRKFPVNDRIEITISCMYKQQLRINQIGKYAVKEIKKELELAHYEEKSEQKRAKINDHALNAFEYAFEPVMYKFAKFNDINKLIFNKKEKIW